MFRMPMVDMAETADEVKQKLADMGATAPGIKPSLPRYPYGLCLSLEDDTLAKLGLDGDLPEVGEMIYFCAVARVTSASESEREQTDGAVHKVCRVELQITQMGVPPADPAEKSMQASKARQSRFYGGDHAEPDGDDA